MPVAWSVVKKGLDPKKFTIATVPALVRKSWAWDDYCEAERPLAPAIKKLAVKL
jgi:bifunctional non-homologous end joining protein LigD